MILMAFHALAILKLLASVAISETQKLSSQTLEFRRFVSKRISNQTTFTNVSITLDQHALCAYVCIQRGLSCFAAQYIQGSMTCSMQLDCGVVLLEDDPTQTISVYVPQRLVKSSVAIRPYLFFPLAKGCSPTFSASYGLQSVTGPPVLVGGPSELNTSYAAFRTTMWFPTFAYPTPTYGLINDSNNALDILRGSFTISYMLNALSSSAGMPVMSFLAGLPNLCLGIRMFGQQSNFFGYTPQCVCQSVTVNQAFMTSWQSINDWMHMTYSYDKPTSSMAVYVNGVLSATFSASLSFASPVSVLMLGALNVCAAYPASSSATGSLACLQMFKTSVNASQAAILYSQCIYGVVLQ